MNTFCSINSQKSFDPEMMAFQGVQAASEASFDPEDALMAQRSVGTIDSQANYMSVRTLAGAIAHAHVRASMHFNLCICACVHYQVRMCACTILWCVRACVRACECVCM